MANLVAAAIAGAGAAALFLVPAVLLLAAQGRLAAARLADRDLLLDGAADHPASRVGLLAGDAHRDGAGRLVGDVLGHVAGVGLGVALRDALADANLAGHLAGHLLGHAHLASLRGVLAVLLGAADRVLLPHRAGNP